MTATQERLTYAFKTQNLTRAFAGFRAVNEVSVEIPQGGVRTIIGPNGAGKTTFFNLLSGLLPPSSGSVWFEGVDITHLRPDRRAHMGIARSFQITNIFGKLSVFENVRLAVQANHDGTANFFLPQSRMGDLESRAVAVLDEVGLLNLADAHAENLSHGDQRRLEIAMVLARDPKVLLLDEPLAGMSPTETHATVALIQQIAADPAKTVILVEHDVDVVLAISRTITVMQTGQVLAIGTPDEIRNNAAVKKAYLGDLV